MLKKTYDNQSKFSRASLGDILPTIHFNASILVLLKIPTLTPVIVFILCYEGANK